MKNKLIFFVLMLFSFIAEQALAQGTAPGTEPLISGNSTYCGEGNNAYQVLLPWNCTFNNWSYTGTMSYEGDLSSPFKQFSFATSGTLTAHCSCGNVNKVITVETSPSVSVSATATSITLGQSVQLNASGAASFSWGGEGLQNFSGASVSAIPTTAGIKNYSVTGYAAGGTCPDTENVSVTVNANAPILDITITHCRDAGDLLLASLGLNLAEGSWSGNGIVGESISLTQLANNTEYLYTYTRTSDNAQGTARITINETIPGSLSASPTASCENNMAGAITLQNHDGNIVRWEQQNSGSETWSPIGNTSSSLQYQTNSSASFRAVVKKGTCSEIPTLPVQINPVVVSPGEINSAALTIGCEAITGSLSISPSGGSVIFWEISFDGNNWTPISQSASSTLNAINQINKTWYRAAVQSASCPVVRSASVNFEPLKPIPGYLNTSTLSTTCGNSSGTLQLQNAATESYEWQRSSGTGWEVITGATTSNYAFATTSAMQYRVKVSRNACEPKYSNVYTAYVTSVGGSTYSNAAQECAQAIGNIQLYGEVGTVVNWEYSQDQVNWAIVPSSAGLTFLPINTTAAVNHYRAWVALENCAGVYSSTQTITVSPPPVPGRVKFKRETRDAETINGQLTFYPEFKLENEVGSVTHWQVRNDYTTQTYSTSEKTFSTTITQTSGFRANVNSANCPSLLSGEAIMVVNRLFEGIFDVLGQRLEINEYAGNSYRIKNAEGMSLQDGFSFQANTAQDFFIILDENYAYPQVDQNYVLEETILQEGITSEDDIYFANAHQRQSKYTYYDGLGRPMQSVARKASPEQKDIVVPFAYDAFGRMPKEFLPFVSAASDGMLKENALETQLGFYLAPPEKIAPSAYPFAVKIFEASPLNRVIEQGAPGTEWQPGIGHSIQSKFATNNPGEITLWTLTESGMPEADGFYNAGELFVNETVDEHGSAVKEYTDKEGHILAKHVQLDSDWLRTVYVYDDFGLLRYVFQPEGTAHVTASPDQEFLDTWTFQYRYDERHRLVEKRVPGGGWVFMVYDARDRLVLSQDANQHPLNQWTFTKYDALNRPVVTGIYTWSNPTEPAAIITRTEMRALVSTTAFAEEFTGSGSLHGYTNTVFPTQDLDLLSVMYYDNYDFITSQFQSQFGYDKDVLEGLPESYFARVKGRVTGTQTKVLGSNTWLKTGNWYDDRYRPIQTLSSNHLGGFDRVSMRYDFVGKVLAQSLKHSNSESEHTINEEFTYDHGGRLLAHYHKLDNGPKILLKTADYNALGQLVETNLHGKADGSFEQSVDYRYNIRGWLTHINNATLTDDGGATNDEANDFFGFEMKYTNPDRVTPQYNGNISQVNWKTTGASRQAFDYSYDDVNRLRDAVFKDMDNPLRNGRFNESISSYDRNGNIMALTRTGQPVANLPGYSTIDNMAYTYIGNRLMLIEDDHAGGFDDKNKEGNDYAYDHNGNMSRDNNKEIETIAYNFLNLPSEISKTNGDHLTYTYSATGAKLSQHAQGTVEKVTDYAGGFVYEGGVLQFLQHAEGRVTMKNAQPVYEYFLKDHLGNVRVAFTTEKEIKESRASLENNRAEEERGEFLNYDNVRKVYSRIADRTNDDSGQDGYAVLLRGGENEKIGLSKSLQIMPGDKVHMEVFAKYIDPTDVNYNGYYFQQLVAALATGLTGPIVIDGPSYGSPGYVPPTGASSDADEEDDGPKAFLRYIFVPNDFDFTQAQANQIKLSDQAQERGNSVSHEKLELEFEATQAGFLYVYFCNDREEPVEDVFFDEFKVVHEKSQIVQSNDYYPFGLAFNSYQGENSVDQNYLYNGKEEQDELDLSWLDYGARMYMPDIGRWGVIDPLAENFYPASPYNYALNNPINLTDPDGRSAEPVIDEKNKTITVNMHFVFYGTGADKDSKEAALATINTMWNANADPETGWSDAGDGWKIKVVATGEVTDEAGAQEIAGDNEGNALYNFIRVEDQNNTTSVDGDNKVSGMEEHNGNSGFWITGDMTDTTPAHETGHGLGLSTMWHENAEGIMVSGTENRKVTTGNLSELRTRIQQNGTDKSGLIDKYWSGVKRMNYGSTNTYIYNQEGKTINKK